MGGRERNNISRAALVVLQFWGSVQKQGGTKQAENENWRKILTKKI